MITQKELLDLLKYDITTDKVRTTYQLNGKLHRDEDQPAVINANGSKYWYQDGLRHRDDDLPAIVYANGTKEWYQNGELHRGNDLPAVINADGSEWYVNGNKVWHKK